MRTHPVVIHTEFSLQGWLTPAPTLRILVADGCLWSLTPSYPSSQEVVDGQ